MKIIITFLFPLLNSLHSKMKLTEKRGFSLVTEGISNFIKQNYLPWTERKQSNLHIGVRESLFPLVH